MSPTAFFTRVPTPYGSAFPTSQPTGAPSAINGSRLQQEGGAFYRSCPDHSFLPGVRVSCVAPLDAPPYLRVQAMSTVNFHLSYAADAQGFNANDDAPLQQPSLPALFVNIPSFIPAGGDFAAFLVDQGSGRSDYVDRLVGMALDGVPIYTALGSGGQGSRGPRTKAANGPIIQIQP